MYIFRLPVGAVSNRTGLERLINSRIYYNGSMNSSIISLPRFIGGIQSDLNNVEKTLPLN